MNHTDIQRRKVLSGTVAIAAFGSGSLLQLLAVRSARADWPSEAFESADAKQALELLLEKTPLDSSEIEIRAPEIAENGAVVPVRVSTTLNKTRSIAIVIPNNPTPLIANYELSTSALPEIATRVKMAEDSEIVAIVSTDSGVYTSKKAVAVSVGGCGG